jgi:hypothetical protein
MKSQHWRAGWSMVSRSNVLSRFAWSDGEGWKFDIGSTPTGSAALSVAQTGINLVLAGHAQ